MHSRRLSAFILGAWILGNLFIAFVASQSFRNVDRILNSPPQAVSKYMEDLGMDVTRLILRFEAAEMNRFLFEAWGLVQIGIGAALVSACVLTAHRSRFLIIGAGTMLVLTLVNTFYVLPSMASLGRSFDFVAATANLHDRENFQDFHIMYSVMEVIKLIIGVMLAIRLIFDRVAWQQRLVPEKRKLRRRRRSSMASGHPEPVSVIEPVEHPDNSPAES